MNNKLFSDGLISVKFSLTLKLITVGDGTLFC